MKKKAFDIVLKHLADFNELLSIDIKSTDIMKKDISYIKWLILELKGDLNQEVDVDEMWKKFLNKDNVL